MHPWIVPTEVESVITSYITLGHVDTIADPTVDLIKKELTGAIAIRRAVRQGRPNVEALHDQPATIDPGATSGVLLVDLFILVAAMLMLMLLPIMMMSMLILMKK